MVEVGTASLKTKHFEYLYNKSSMEELLELATLSKKK